MTAEEFAIIEAEDQGASFRMRQHVRQLTLFIANLEPLEEYEN